MISFKEFLAEVFNSGLYNNKQEKKCELFLGRLQPLHKGHAAIINSMKNPIVAIVKGAKTSLNKEKNPLPLSMQISLLEKVFPNINNSNSEEFPKYIESPTSYIPDIINQIRDLGYEVEKIYAGADRISGYETQIDSYNKKPGIENSEKNIDVKFKETPRITSTTEVRTAIKGVLNSKDQKEEEKYMDDYKSNMPKELQDKTSFDEIAEYFKDINEETVGSSEYTDNITLAYNTTDNTTDNIEDKDNPMNFKNEKKSKRLLRRKKVYNL